MKEIIALIVAVITIFYNYWSQYNTRKKENHAITTAIRSDIRSLVLALEEMHLVEGFVNALKDDGNENNTLSAWVDAPRKEDYFQLFCALGPQIGRLEKDMAREVVRFYTFFKVARDAVIPLGALSNEDKANKKHIEHVKNALVALKQCMEASKVVLSDKFGTRNTGTENADNIRKMICGALDKYATKMKITKTSSTVPVSVPPAAPPPAPASPPPPPA